MASTINSLIETLKDGEAGFKTAAADVNDATVKATFNEFARQRSQMAGELASHLRGEDAKSSPDSGSISGAAHRGWMNIKSALGGGEQAILNEAERGEDQAVHAYEDAMKDENLPNDIADIVRRQYREVKQAHDRVKAMRDSWKK
jgi:uncharacterized protein (TIGR02284 family)